MCTRMSSRPSSIDSITERLALPKLEVRRSGPVPFDLLGRPYAESGAAATIDRRRRSGPEDERRRGAAAVARAPAAPAAVVVVLVADDDIERRRATLLLLVVVFFFFLEDAGSSELAYALMLARPIVLLRRTFEAGGRLRLIAATPLRGLFLSAWGGGGGGGGGTQGVMNHGELGTGCLGVAGFPSAPKAGRGRPGSQLQLRFCKGWSATR